MLIEGKEFLKRQARLNGSIDAMLEEADSSATSLYKAKRLYKKILRIDNELLYAHLQLGLLFFFEDEFRMALRHFNHVVRINATCIEGNFNLARTLQRVGQFEKAVDAYQRVLAINPCHTNSIFNIAFLYDEMNMPRVALPYWKKYAQLDPAGNDHDLAVIRARRITACDVLMITSRQSLQKTS